MKRTIALLAVAALAASACGSSDAKSGGVNGDELIGTFKVNAGDCDGKKTSGSFMRMVNPGGELESGPFVDNGDSPCKDKTYTPFIPGTDGGLSTVEIQAAPKPVFAESGDALANTIMEPQGFYGVNYSVSVNEVDLQTEEKAAPPTIAVDGEGTLTGEIAGWVVSWNGQHFNQGAPKPDGSTPGLTREPTGTYDEKTGRFTLEWSSRVVGGPFDSFTGVWHLEGVFEPSKDAQ